METESVAPSTIYDVALHAGVSIATVSRVLNGHSHLKPQTRDLVLQSVKDLQFVPNSSARGLSSGQKRVLGLMFVRTSSEELLEIVQESLLFTDSVIRGAELSASTRGYSLLLGGVNRGRDSETTERMISKCDGLIVLDRAIPERFIPSVSRKIPTVLLAGNGKSRSALSVRVDNAASMAGLAKHLVVDHGRKRLAFLSGFRSSPDSQARRLAFVEAATALGAMVEDDELWYSDYTSAGAARVIDERMRVSTEPPEGIACANDQGAIGAIHALSQKGIRVPSDVAITGFDDIHVGRHLSPALTTVRQPVQELGSAAVDALLRAITSPGGEARRDTVLPTEIVLRQSCGCSS